MVSIVLFAQDIPTIITQQQSNSPKPCDVEVTLNGSTCLPNLMKIHQSVQKLKIVRNVMKTTQQSNTPNNTNPTIKQSQTIGYARLNIMPPTNNFVPQPL
jgi:hypothetical protein